MKHINRMSKKELEMEFFRLSKMPGSISFTGLTLNVCDEVVDCLMRTQNRRSRKKRAVKKFLKANTFFFGLFAALLEIGVEAHIVASEELNKKKVKQILGEDYE